MSKSEQKRAQLWRPRGRFPSWLPLAALGVGIIMGGAAITAQSKKPAFSDDDLDKAMKSVGVGFTLVKHALAKNDPENAKDYLARTREHLSATISFWRQRQKDDAVRMLRVAVRHLDDLDPILAAEAVDGPVVNTHVQQAEAACAACHAVYREQDPVTKEFRLKAGSVQ